MRLHSFERGRSIDVETFSRIVVRPSISFRMLSIETISQILIFADQSEKQMLGFDRRAPELASFIAGEEYDPSCSLGISFEHSLLILSCSRHLATRAPLRLIPWSTRRLRGCFDSKRCA